MREGIKTSLLSILCVVATAAANAAPTVRTIGGTSAGTYSSAADAAASTATSRAGSLRATGGFVRPTTASSISGTTSHTTPGATATTTSTATGGSVASGTGTVGRVASTPRLSIGKYINAPKSVSSSAAATNDLTSRVEKLETDMPGKQDALSDTTYITVAGDELILNVEKIKEDLEITNGTDGREIEMGTNDDGLLWRYVGDSEWQTPPLVTWAELSEKLNVDDMNTRVSDSITELRTEIMGELDKKLDKEQGTGENGELVGRAMVIGSDGFLHPTGDFANKDDVYTKTQVDSKITEINETIVTSDDLDKKVDIHQGDDPNLIGMAMVVNSNGDLEPTGDFVTAGELDNLIENYELDNFGQLAYMDSVGSAQINANAVKTEELANAAVTTEKLADAAVERAKLANDITKTLTGAEFWEQWWNEHREELESGDYVVAVTPNTNASNPPQLFRVITADEDNTDDTPTEP